MEDKRKQGFSKKIKIAMTNCVKVFEEPGIYGFTQENKEEQNKAILNFLKAICDFEGDTVVGFKEDFIKQYSELKKLPTIKLL